ncbi:hypothetical protein TMatcc_008547 [Talaromyces marneffei ATCC 18224]
MYLVHLSEHEIRPLVKSINHLPRRLGDIFPQISRADIIRFSKSFGDFVTFTAISFVQSKILDRSYVGQYVCFSDVFNVDFGATWSIVGSFAESFEFADATAEEGRIINSSGAVGED